MQFSLLTGLPEPITRLGSVGLDEKLEEILPGDHRAWPQPERERLVERLLGLLVDDMVAMFESHQRRDRAGGLVFRDEEDRRDFLALLGWVCGHRWRIVSHVPFSWAMRHLGFGGGQIRTIREAVAETYATELELARELFSGELTLQ